MNNFDFLVINYDLNQQYFIEKSVIEKIICYVFSKLNKITLVEKEVLINKDGSDFEIKLQIKKDEKMKVSKTVKVIEENLNYLLLNLCTYKAKNVQIEIN